MVRQTDPAFYETAVAEAPAGNAAIAAGLDGLDEMEGDAALTVPGHCSAH